MRNQLLGHNLQTVETKHEVPISIHITTLAIDKHDVENEHSQTLVVDTYKQSMKDHR